MHKTTLMAGVSALTLMLAGTALADQGAKASINDYEDSYVGGNVSKDYGSLRDNNIEDVLPDAGVMHVQQNNGSSNDIAAASAVQANLNGNGRTRTSAKVFGFTEENYVFNEGGKRTNDILDSFNSFSGVLSVQQNNGDSNTMGVANAVHGNSGGYAWMRQRALTEGASAGNGGPYRKVTDYGSTRTNLIDPAFLGAQGIVSVQQNNGNVNSMGIANSVALNTGAGFVRQSAETYGTAGRQRVADYSKKRHNAITDDSFDAADGIMNVQQNNGDGNVMGIANTVAANKGAHVAAQNDVVQRAATHGRVIRARAFDYDARYPRGQRDNVIDGTFDNAEGIMNVQQNNGSNNVMGIANAVQVNEGTSKVHPRFDRVDVVGDQFALSVGGSVDGAASQMGSPLNPNYSGPAHRENDLRAAFDSVGGIANVQQNNGDNNVMGSANAVVANMYSGDNTDYVRRSRAITDGSVEGSEASEWRIGANRDNHLTNSFKGADGLMVVQQNNGNNNVIGAANAVVANVGTDDYMANSARNGAFGYAYVDDNYAATRRYTDRVNVIDRSAFDGAIGIMTVTQNNGDNNVMGASTAVVADLGDTSGFGPAASTAALSATVSGNTTVVASTVGLPGLSNTLNGSFNSAKGIMTVQQNNGSNNAIQSAISVSANLSLD